ncbi:hypothetical protein [Saccharopolyspora griseoalba]|uniref:Uncharacterized protein n=1 Tax=Saccharopolyspora griseoalba TaxID=1431848 RepID=A0ABW2LN36_9PSEU
MGPCVGDLGEHLPTSLVERLIGGASRSRITVQGRAVGFFDDVDLELVDRMSAVHTGTPYGIRRPRAAVRLEITDWSHPVPKTDT